jgi:membrane protease YdiL (CAAX protease family)
MVLAAPGPARCGGTISAVGDPVTTAGAPPGWYPDPWRQAWWRWWDGATWTAYTEQWGAPAPGADEPRLRAGGIAILGFLAGLAISIAIDLVLIVVAGYAATDPAVLLGSSLGLWIGLGGSCVVAVKRKGTGSLRDLGLVRPTWADPALGLGLGLGGLFVVGVIAIALEAINSNLLPGDGSELRPVEDGGTLGVIVLYLIAVVGAPFFEELYFRGLVQGGLTARWGVRVSVVVQALLFGLVHLNPEVGWGNVGIFVVITTVGIGLGVIRRVAGRLPPAMFTHAVYNAVIVTVALLAVE